MRPSAFFPRPSDMRNFILAALLCAVTACGSDGVIAPVSRVADPVITMGSVSLLPAVVFGSLVSVTATVTVTNSGGAGVWALRSVADSARHKPCYLTPPNSQAAAIGRLAAQATATVTAVTACSGKLDYLVLYGGTEADVAAIPPVGCYAIGSKPCPALAEFVAQ